MLRTRISSWRPTRSWRPDFPHHFYCDPKPALHVKRREPLKSLTEAEMVPVRGCLSRPTSEHNGPQKDGPGKLSPSLDRLRSETGSETPILLPSLL